MTRAHLIALALFVTVVASRAPFAAQTLWAHDSVLYANAIERGFHVDDALTRSRPHPPGYLFYVASADVAHAAGLDANTSLVLIAALASALTAVALFLVSRRWTSDGVALVAAAAFAADPLVWQYSDIAFPYTVLALCSVTVAAALRWARGRGLAAGLVATAVVGVAAGFRQDILVLAGPLWVWAVAPLGARRAALAAGALAVACLSWLGPTVVLSDGVDEYVASLVAQATFVRETYSVVAQGTPALVANVLLTGYALAWGSLLLVPVTAIAMLGGRMRIRDDAAFFVLWSVPPLVVYVALHIGDWGYVLSALPAAYVLGARALDRVVASVARPRLALAAATASLVALPAGAFAALPTTFSATAIAAHDTELAARVAYVRENYVPRSTLILTREDFMLVRYYLPDYRARQYDPEPYTHATRRMRIGGVDHVVVFTAGLVPERQLDVRRAQCRTGVTFVYLDVAPGSVLEFRGERYSVSSVTP